MRGRTSDAYFSPPNHDGFFFGKLGWDEDYESPNGTLKIDYILNQKDINETVSLLFEADVTSPSRQIISGRTSVIVHGGEYYIGIKSSSTFIASDSTLNYQIVTTKKDGNRLKTQNLTAKIYERQWHSICTAGVGGAYEWETEKIDVLIDSSEVSISGTNGVTQKYFPTKAGFYLIRCEGIDKRGNKILSEAYFYVSGNSYVAWSRSDDDRIELVSNKKSYKPGEVANVIVKSPYEKATALISIEREVIYIILSITALIPLGDDKFETRSTQSVKIFDRNGILLREIFNEKEGRGEWKKLNEISPNVVKALISAEDKRYYVHPGFDPLAMARAIWQNISSVRVISGGSTITQQVIRNVYNHPRTLKLRFWSNI